ncbi:hypothetical protein [Rarobacter incanus]|uniref:Uncharacterized protein n=1 Tax=Rarobacter incanus TaxID=153494 RepID=A0A542SQE2_9MICO|nr:hypothetical protein [Rarobacter incanus]TQK76808.1 hypothetical protein FB389_1501 [Rarobacter incanus]
MKSHEIALSSVALGRLLVTVAGCGTEPEGSNASAGFPHTGSLAEDYPFASLDGKLSIEASESGYYPRLVSEHRISYLLVLPPNAEVGANTVKIGDRTLTVGDISVGGGEMATDVDGAGCSSQSPAWLVAP